MDQLKAEAIAAIAATAEAAVDEVTDGKQIEKAKTIQAAMNDVRRKLSQAARSVTHLDSEGLMDLIDAVDSCVLVLEAITGVKANG